MKKTNVNKKHISKKKKIIITTIILILIIAFSVMAATKTTPIKLYQLARQALTGTTSMTYSDEPRAKFNFNYDWQFSKGQGKNNSGSDLPSESVSIIPDTNKDALMSQTYSQGSSGETWENVSLPHTYNDVDTFDNYMESAQNGERSMYSGTAWYTKTFTIPSEYEGKRIYIEFEAARQAAKVSLNGHILEGTYENGFIPFGYDLTNYINYGGENKITVMVDNTFPYYMEGTGDKVPWHDSHWQPNYGGLYRNSYLYVMDQVQLTLPLNSFVQTEGTYIYTSDETDNTAVINIEAQVQNNTQNIKNLKLVAYVKKANGDVALEITGDTFQLAAGETNIAKISDKLTNAIRWSTTYPYLYTVDCKIIDVSTNTVLDNNSSEMGIRTFKFTNDYGMYLNGNYTKLTGWGQKPTNEWAGLGAAYPDWMQDFTIKLMKNAGGNFIRWGHCAGSPTAIESANKYGLVVLQPGVEGEGNYGGVSYTTNTYKLRTDAFKDMIIYYRNNPSILLWEIGNQAISDLSVAETLTGYIQKYDHGSRMYNSKDSNNTFYNSEVIKNSGSWADTINTSERVGALRQGNSSMKNYVSVGITTQGGSSMAGSATGSKPSVEGEYNRLEARRGVWDFFTKGYSNFENKLGSSVTSSSDKTLYGKVTSEEYAKYQATSYANMIGSNSHCGGANWIFSDSISHGRVVSETSRVSGEVDATMLEKQSYYVTKVMFSNTASAHIIGHWNYEEGTTKDVFVAAKGNQITSATLTVTAENGEKTTYAGNLTSTFLWTFKNVVYKKGQISVEFKNSSNEVVTSDSITSHGEPASLKITPVDVGQTLYANGSDVLLLDVEILDSNGNRCITFDGVRDNLTTNFTVNNQTIDETEDLVCQWRGGYNSSLENTINQKHLYIESGITRIALKTKMTAGNISVTASTKINDNLTLTDTYLATSIPIPDNNNNGYSTLENYTPDYNLDGLTNSGVGNDTKPGETEDVGINDKYTSELMESVGYTGNTELGYEIVPVLENGATIYKDTNETFTSVPYKYQNAEYLKIPSSDRGTLAVDLINFIVLKNVDVILLRDPEVPNPTWMSEFRKTGDIVTGSNGVLYEVYRKSFKAGQRVTLGANGETSSDGVKGWMNVVAVKETDKINNSIFFDESFNNVNIDQTTNDNIVYKPSTNGWILNTTGNDITFLEERLDDKDTMHVVDNSTSAMGYAYKSFATQTNKVKISYKLNVSSQSLGTAGSNKNNFIRLWLHNGAASHNVKDLSKTLIETYLQNTSLIYKTKANTTAVNIATNITNDSWHTMDYLIDIPNGTFKSGIDGTYTGTNYPLYNPGANMQGNTVVISSANAHYNNFYVSNVNVEPVANTAITGIKVNGVNISEFHQLTKDYLVLATASERNVQIEKGSTYSSGGVSYADDKSYADITIIDTSNVTYNYRVYFKDTIANKTELRSLVSEVNGLDKDCYTVDSWTNVATEKNLAMEIIENENAALTSINSSIIRLRDVIKALIIDREAVINKY